MARHPSVLDWFVLVFVDQAAKFEDVQLNPLFAEYPLLPSPLSSRLANKRRKTKKEN
jgi:hypothetical protein